MAHPTDIPGFRTALGALDAGDLPVIAPGDGVTEEQADAATAAILGAIQDAQATVSPVPQCGQVLDTLKDHAADLGLAAARVLAAAAHLVLTNSWLGRAEEADGIRDAARARIAAIEG
jgi:hypothetical protein